MTAGTVRPAPDTAGEREPGRARLVLDVEFAVEEVVATLLRAELMRGATVDVMLQFPRLSWSTDAALVSRRGGGERRPVGDGGRSWYGSPDHGPPS